MTKNGVRVFNASESKSISSSGFTNHSGATKSGLHAALDAVFAEWQDAVVIDGDDNWSAHEKNRPEVFARKLGVTPVALFHTKISGMTHSGIVVASDDFDRLAAGYQAKYGEPLRGHKPDRKAWFSKLLVYTQDNYDGHDE